MLLFLNWNPALLIILASGQQVIENNHLNHRSDSLKFWRECSKNNSPWTKLLLIWFGIARSLTLLMLNIGSKSHRTLCRNYKDHDSLLKHLTHEWISTDQKMKLKQKKYKALACARMLSVNIVLFNSHISGRRRRKKEKEEKSI